MENELTQDVASALSPAQERLRSITVKDLFYFLAKLLGASLLLLVVVGVPILILAAAIANISR